MAAASLRCVGPEACWGGGGGHQEWGQVAGGVRGQGDRAGARLRGLLCVLGGSWSGVAEKCE